MPACTQRTPQHLTSAFSSWSPVHLRTNLGAMCNRAQSVLHIHYQQAHATLPCTCPCHSAHIHIQRIRPLSRQSKKLPHDKRPACIQRTPQHLTSAFSSWSPVQLRTNLGAMCNRAQSAPHIHHLIHHRPPSTVLGNHATHTQGCWPSSRRCVAGSLWCWWHKPGMVR